MGVRRRSGWIALLTLASLVTFSAAQPHAEGSPPSWTYTGGPAPNKTYRVYSLLADASNPGSVYAGTSYGGVFKTSDGGGAWNQLTVGINPIVYGMAVHPADAAVLYVADWWGALYKSTDHGATWSSLTSPSFGVRALAVSPASPFAIFAGSGNGVHKSVDGGARGPGLAAPRCSVVSKRS